MSSCVTRIETTAPAWLAAASEVAIDFETFYAAGYSVQDLGYSAYVNDTRFDATLVAASDGAHSLACRPRDFPWPMLHGKTLIAHNAGFDFAVFSRLQEIGIIPRDVMPAAWHDSAALCAYIGAPRALDEAADVLLGMKIDKTVRDRMKGGADLFDAADDYAASDAIAAARIWQKFSQHWPEHERELSRVTIAMGFRGVAVDGKKAREIFQTLDDTTESAKLSLPWFPKQAPTSPKAIAAHCEKHGVPPPETTSAKEEAFDEWLELHGQTEPARAIRIVQEIRSLNRSAKVLATMLARVRADGRIDAHTLYFGASTGRWSGGGHGLNLQNLNRNEAGNADLRGCLVAAPGKKFVIVDLSQIEPRCLAWMAGDRAWLDLIRGGMNPYEAHAMTAHGWRGEKLKTSNPRLYSLCKAERLGLGYGCGAQKFVSVAKTLGDIEVTPEESRKIVNDFRRGNPAITNLWNRLEDAFRKRDGADYRLALPSGRRLRYLDVSSDDMTARVVCRGPRLNFYGGKLCENLIQAIARDVFADGLLRAEQCGLNPILTVHDELICEVPEAKADAALHLAKTVLTIPPVWAPDLPVAAEGEIASFYKK